MLLIAGVLNLALAGWNLSDVIADPSDTWSMVSLFITAPLGVAGVAFGLARDH
jgi:hypothetical protein